MLNFKETIRRATAIFLASVLAFSASPLAFADVKIVNSQSSESQTDKPQLSPSTSTETSSPTESPMPNSSSESPVTIYAGRASSEEQLQNEVALNPDQPVVYVRRGLPELVTAVVRYTEEEVDPESLERAVERGSLFCYILAKSKMFLVKLIVKISGRAATYSATGALLAELFFPEQTSWLAGVGFALASLEAISDICAFYNEEMAKKQQFEEIQVGVG